VSQDLAQQKFLNFLFLDASLDVFLFLHSTTCTKFCCKNLETEFSQHIIILNLLSFVLLILNR